MRTSACSHFSTAARSGPATPRSCRGSISPIIDEAPADLLAGIVTVGQKLARAMKQTLHVPRVAFLFTGGDIAHVHAHAVPIHEETDITSRRYIVEETVTFRSLPCPSDRELAKTAADLRRALAGRRRARIAQIG